jgi:hypothetical protein
MNSPYQPPKPRWRRLLHRKLLLRLTLPLLIALVQLGLALAEIVGGKAPPALVVWLLPGLLVGLGFGRATRVAWNPDASQVALVGGQAALSLAFLVVQLGARPVLARALGDLSYAGAIALIVAVGLVAGRSLGLLGRIREALAHPGD